MDERIRILSNYRMDKARQDLETAKMNLENNKLAQSVNRSYYAIFHALRSLIAYDIFDSKRHSSIIGFFNKKKDKMLACRSCSRKTNK